jgi:hypothetical protein
MLAVTTSEIKVSVLIAEDYTELAVRVLHTAFGLDAGQGKPHERRRMISNNAAFMAMPAATGSSS